MELIELRQELAKQVEELQREIEARDIGVGAAMPSGSQSPPRVASPINA